MTLPDFIKENKADLRASINRVLGRDESRPVSNAECRMWILNDESLYRWARSSGVRI